MPYKVPEAAIRAFATSPALAAHRLDVIGDGPELERLQAIVTEAGASDRVVFHGRKTQAEVAEAMRLSDAFVFPSIRELGAGVVIEAMASGVVTIVTDYGAPGDLAANGRGVVVPLGPLDELTAGFQTAMEGCLSDAAGRQVMAQKAETYARSLYEWDTKAEWTLRLYEAVLEDRQLDGITDNL